jgi:hypothetical protein
VAAKAQEGEEVGGGVHREIVDHAEEMAVA